ALLYSGVPVEKIHDPSFGEWRCHTGEHEGELCEPTDLASCGRGFFRSRVEDQALGCVGYGPATFSLDFVQFQIGGAQKPEARQELRPGVFAQVPIEGILYWSSHAFNLTTKDHDLNGRINFWFAEDQRYPVL